MIEGVRPSICDSAIAARLLSDPRVVHSSVVTRTDPMPLNDASSADRFRLPPNLEGSPAALVVAHPGHELRVFGWLCLARPSVFVLTDGSGRTGKSRLPATTDLIEQIGARRGRLYGRYSDMDVYESILGQDTRFFTSLADELADALVDSEVRYVVGDANEGYNPVHDVCRRIINTAVRLARRRLDYQIDNLDFLLVGDPAGQSGAENGSGIRLSLNEEIHSRKLRAASAYSELSGDVDQALGSFGTEAFKVECLRIVMASDPLSEQFDVPPFYEQYGAKQVAAGYYSRVVRYREHMIPIFASLDNYMGQSA